MKEIIRRIEGAMKASLKTARIRFRSFLETRRFDPQGDILLLQMGKVGSSSVYKAIRKSRFSGQVFQLHMINPDSIDSAMRKVKSSKSPRIDSHLIYSSRLSPVVLSTATPLKIITMSREPISRALSFCFQDFKRQFGFALEGEDQWEAYNQVAKTKLSIGSPHADPGLWFESELGKTLGINVFNQPIDVSEGAVRLDFPRASILLIRMEDLANAAVVDSISEFIGCNVSLVNSKSNVGAEKSGGSAYFDWQSQFTMDRDEIKRIIGTEYFRTFYPDYGERTLARFSIL